MSEFGDIEGGVVALIASVEDNGEAAFASVKGWAAADRKSAVGFASRLSKPAAVVTVAGREKFSKTDAVPGDVRVSVLIAARNLRSPEGGRLGDVDGPGVFELSGWVAAALDGAVVATDRRLSVIDEQIAAADERSVMIEQRWLAERTAGLTPPTFGGEAITGSDAVVSVQVGERESRAISFGFPGIDGVFRHELGASGRVILWSGQLRAADHVSLNSIEAGIESRVGDGLAEDLVDSFGRTFVDCVVTGFRRSGPRRVRATTGALAQNFELAFLQPAG